MKKIISLSLSALLMMGFAACKKNNSNSSGTNPFGSTNNNTTPTPVVVTLPVGDVPKNFTKKAILEEFTGEWCGWCPTGAQIMQTLVDANPDRFYGVALHDGDPFEVPFKQTIQSYIIAGAGITSLGYPCGSVSRTPSVTANYLNSALDDRNKWSEQANTNLAKKADCGIALVTKEAGDKLDIDVYVGYDKPVTTPKGIIKLTIYLIENDLPESSPGAQASGGGNYVHQHVFRKVLTADFGDDITLASTDKYTKVSYKGLDIAGAYTNKSKCKVLVFVNQDSPAGDDLDVLNAQEAGLNEIKKWD